LRTKVDENGKTVTEKIIKTGEDEDVRIVELDDDVRILHKDGDGHDEDFDIRIEADSVPRYHLRIFKDGKPLEFEWEGAGNFPDELHEYFGELEHRGPIPFFGPSRAFLGIRMGYEEEVEIENGEEERHSEGIRIERVIEDSPAEAAGLQAGDLLIALDGRPVRTPAEVGEYILDKKPGDEVKITYRRAGQEAETTVTLADSKDFAHGFFFFNDDGDFDFDFDLDEDFDLDLDEEDFDFDFRGKHQDHEEELFRQNLELKSFEVAPNPTRGVLKVRFEAEPKPTVLTLTDPAGRFHFRQEIRQFDGSYDGNINLEGAPKGVLYLTIRQGNRSFTEGVVYQ
ncbi:MAG: PDZ domain-containing protein, partial [Bacteroidetes bacterium]